MSPAARWASSSRSRNQSAAAGPIVPLIDQGAPADGLSHRASVAAISEEVRLGETYWSFQ